VVGAAPPNLVVQTHRLWYKQKKEDPVSEKDKKREVQVGFVLEVINRSIDAVAPFAPDLSPEDVVALLTVALAMRVRGGGTPLAGWLMAANAAYESAGDILAFEAAASRPNVAQA